jgi:hypothetical protein
VLRDLIRIQIFGRFHHALGAAIGVAVAILAAWATAFGAGPRALAWKPLLAIALACAGAGAWVLPRAVERSKRSPGARDALRGAFAVGFLLLVLAAGVAAFAAGFGSLALLLASTGLSSETGVAIFRGGSAAVVGALSLALAWGFGIEPLRLEVTRTRVGLSGAAPELRIAQLSDLHIGNGLDGARLDALVERANALAADLVVLTGDLFDYDRSAVEAGARALGRLYAPLGVFAVLGNHDVYVGTDRIAAALAALAPAVTLLRDAWRRLPTGVPLYLAGVEDPGRDWTGRGRELPALAALGASVPKDGPAILLVHRPDAFPQAARLGFPLVLAGHYHGGQVAMGARMNAARLLSPFCRGLYRDGSSQLYVSRGLGFAGPRIRLGSRREIALIEVGAELSAPSSRRASSR